MRQFQFVMNFEGELPRAMLAKLLDELAASVGEIPEEDSTLPLLGGDREDPELAGVVRVESRKEHQLSWYKVEA